jgi:hypothetical protein
MQADFDIDDRHIGRGLRLWRAGRARSTRSSSPGAREGLVLDPVYSGKAFAGMLAQLREGRWPGDAPVVFFHSGGAPGLFAKCRAGMLASDAKVAALTRPRTPCHDTAGLTISPSARSR